MQTSSGFGLLLALGLALVPAPSDAETKPYPHDTTKPDYCLDCHTAAIHQHNCDDPSGFCLLAGSVDGLCLLCHVREDCCRTGQEHQGRLFIGMRGHASDLEEREIDPRFRPTTLPLQHDKMTCRTCHLHRRESPETYKLLRLVTVTGDKVDWSVLCRDCHKVY